MNGFTRTPRRNGAGRLLWLGLVVIYGGGWCANHAEAAAIHHTHEAALAEAHPYRTWAGYLLGGPSVWAHVYHPPWNNAAENSLLKLMRTDPSPEADAAIQFFMYRQSLAPARFDYYHPRVAAALRRIKREEASSSSTTPVTSSSSTSSPSQGAQEITPAAVPEPSTLLLTIGLAGYALCSLAPPLKWYSDTVSMRMNRAVPGGVRGGMPDHSRVMTSIDDRGSMSGHRGKR